MIVAGAFFGQTTGRNGEQRERRAGPDIPKGFAKFPSRFQLLIGAVGDDAQVHVAVRPRFTSRIRAEQIHGLQWHYAIHRFQTIRKRLALALEARRQIVEAQFHAATLQRPRRSGKPGVAWLGLVLSRGVEEANFVLRERNRNVAGAEFLHDGLVELGSGRSVIRHVDPRLDGNVDGRIRK